MTMRLPTAMICCVHQVSSATSCSPILWRLYRLPVRCASALVFSTCASYPRGQPGPSAARKYMPLLPEWFSFTSALDSRLVYVFGLNKWLTGPCPMSAPALTSHFPGVGAIQPLNVFPSKTLNQPLASGFSGSGLPGSVWADRAELAGGSARNIRQLNSVMVL